MLKKIHITDREAAFLLPPQRNLPRVGFYRRLYNLTGFVCIFSQGNLIFIFLSPSKDDPSQMPLTTVFIISLHDFLAYDARC